MSVEEKIIEAFKTMGNLGSTAEQRTLRSQARSHSLDGWKAYNRTIVATVGGVSGIPGGLIGVALEGIDIAVLLNRCARASYGVGYILRKNEELLGDFDMTMILAIWTGSAVACSSIPAGQLALKTSLKAGTHIAVFTANSLGTTVATKAGAHAAIVAVNSLGTTVATKAGSMMLSRSSDTLVTFGSKVTALAGKKLAVKGAHKFFFKSIPLIGGIAGALINLWVLNGLMDAAEKFYRNEYVVPKDPEVIKSLRSAAGLA